MRIVIVIAAVILLAGCSKDVSPTQTVGIFIEALGAGHPEKTTKLLNDESQVMASTNLVVGQGIAWLAAEASRSKSGYQLALEKSADRKASVLLKANWDTSMFLESRFPPQLRKQGVRFYIVKESGGWKIDLLRTENELSDIGLDYLSKVNNGALPSVRPLWMPAPPGIPPGLPGDTIP